MFVTMVEGLMALPESQLDAHLRELEVRRRLDAEFAATIAVAERRQLPAADGHRSINAYLRATINCSSGDASRWRSLARAVDHVDGLGERWLSGCIGWSQVTQLAGLHGNRRVRDRLPEFASLLLDDAGQLPFPDFEICVAEFVRRADSDGAHDALDDAIEHRDAHVVDVGGTLDVTARGGDGVTTAELIAIHQRFTEAEYRADVAARRAEHGDRADAHPLQRTARQRRYDALVAIFRSAAGAERVGGAADPVVNIVIDASTWAELLVECGLAPDTDLADTPVDPFTGLHDPSALLDELVSAPASLSDRRCETTNGVTMHPHEVLRAALAGHVRRVVVDRDGVVVDLGRKRRLFTGSARLAALMLIRRCEHPGCDLPADWCDVDHAHEWADGGSTDQANARIRCGRHNDDKSKRRWRSRRATNGLTYTIRADGTVMLPVGVRPPTFPDDDDPDHPDPSIDQTNGLVRARVAALRTA